MIALRIPEAGQTLPLFTGRANAIPNDCSVPAPGSFPVPLAVSSALFRNPSERSVSTASNPLDIFHAQLFQGQTAVVTGGGSGIGLAIAEGFMRYGANVVIAGRDSSRLESATDHLANMAGTGTNGCLGVSTNIRDTNQVENLRDRALDAFGRIDFLINNAGGQFPARPSQISDNGWRAVVDLNLNGTWNMCQRFAPVMVEQGSGAIVNMVHVYSFNRGAPPFVHSGAARAGVVSMTQTLSYYLARKGVTVNALAPGSIDTRGIHEEEFASAEYDDLAESTLRDVPAQRMGTAEEVAAITLFLCSPAARYINGASIVADGGQFMGNWAPMVDPEMF
jgi:NAD(P)-dependent dehydrogenase (short-subunit alcohol dehydrogenase family)